MEREGWKNREVACVSVSDKVPLPQVCFPHHHSLAVMCRLCVCDFAFAADERHIFLLTGYSVSNLFHCMPINIHGNYTGCVTK